MKEQDMGKNEWPAYGDSFEDPFDDAAIVDSPESLSCMIDWIFEIAEKPEIGKKPGFWKHYCFDAFNLAEMIRDFNRKFIHPPDATFYSQADLRKLQIWCANPYGPKHLSKKQEVFLREAKSLRILNKNPNIKLEELAAELDVSQATASRLKCWKNHKAGPPRERFRNTVDSPHQIKPKP